MKHSFLTLIFLLLCFASKAQASLVKDLSDEKSANYLLANIKEVNYRHHDLFDRSLFVSIFTITDSKATPEGYFEGNDGVLCSLLVTVLPDGDYYSQSKLLKIEGLENPKVKGISEVKYPMFDVLVETGPAGAREDKVFQLDGKLDQ